VAGAVESLFLLHERGTSASREVRGGGATFFAPAFALGPIERRLGVR
jgi:xanthine/uracil/vitamin C permease (AzgA family)